MLYFAEKMLRAVGEDGYCVIRPEAAERVHHSALEILRETGCRIDHERMRDLLQSIGAISVPGTDIIKFPSDIIESALEEQRSPAAPPPDSVKVSAVVGGLTTNTYDLTEDRVRPSTIADLEKACILGEVLDEVPAVGPLFIPLDVPAETNTIHAAATMVTRTRKATCFEIFSHKAVKGVKEVLSVAAGGWEEAKRRYDTSYRSYITSPLNFSREALEMGFHALDEGYTVYWGLPMSMAGSSAPITVMGALTVSCADSLVGLMCGKATGKSVFPGLTPVIVDPATGMTQYSGPDRTILSLASADMLCYYGQARGAHMGFTDACMPGYQAGFEKAYGMLMQIMAWGSAYTAAGLLGPGGNCGSIEQILIDVESAATLQRLFADVPDDDDTIALDLIKELGHGGNYMAEEHTVRYFREVLWFPKLFGRFKYAEEKQSEQEVVFRAHEMANSLISRRPQILSEDQEREIDGIVAAYDGE